MPNYYAHTVFGREVLAQLPPLLRSQLESQRQAFDVGLYGPDPLFFYHPATRNFPRVTGMTMHKRPVRPVAERLLQAVRDDLPYARGYAAGFLCHFALDSRCHYYIEAQAASSDLTHSGMEAELDRALMLADGIDPLHETPIAPLDLPHSFYETVTAAAYPGVRPGQFAGGLRLFRRMCRFQTCLGGTRASDAANWVGSRWPRWTAAKGSLLPSDPDPLYAENTATLLCLLRGEVAGTAEELTRFFTVVARGGALGPWYDRPFSGQWTAEHTGAVRAAAAR